MVAQVIGLPFHLTLDASPKQGLEVVQGQGRPIGVSSNGSRHRMVRTSRQRLGNRLCPAFEGGIEQRVVGLHWLAMGQRAGLVQRQIVQLVTTFQVHAPLTRMPLRAAAAKALTMVTGVEITSAHGQATTNSTSAR